MSWQTINRRNVKLIYAREVRDQLRDRRTLFMIVCLPLMLYPLIGMGFLQVGQFLKSQPSEILIIAEGELPQTPPLLQDGRIRDEYVVDTTQLHIEVKSLAELGLAPADIPDWAMEQIDSGGRHAVVYVPAAFAQRIESIRNSQAPGALAGVDSEPAVFFNTAKDKSRMGYDRISIVMSRWRDHIVDDALKRRQLPTETKMPFSIQARDVAEPLGQRAAVWSKILPLVVLAWSMTGAFYPAIDLCAGEKERGTLETLLSGPAARIEIVWGKLLTIMTFSITTALLNLLCMAVTSTYIMSQFQAALTADLSSASIGPPPMRSILWLLLAVVPISAFFSALALALATLARSTKEGQYYLMPMLLVLMPLMMLAMMPTSELELGTSLIPVTGVLLLLRKLMEGGYQDALIYVVPVIGVTSVCCWAAIRWAVDQFNNESVLFSESERLDLGLRIIQLFRDRKPTPGVAEALMCGIVILIVRFFAGMAVDLPETWNGFVVVTAVTMVAFIAAPALLMSVMLTTHPRKTLLLQRPDSWLAVPMAVLLAVCLHPVVVGFKSLVSQIYPIDFEILKPLEDVIQQAPGLPYLLLILAVLPAVCEELVFRGFILSGLRHSGSKWRAIIVTSIFFGLTHGLLQQSIVATVFGVVLGYVAVQTSSLLPCIVFHATHNSLAILAGKLVEWVQENPTWFWLIRRSENAKDFYYCLPIVVVAIVLSAIVLRWFQQLQYQPYEEERLHDAIEQQAAVAVR